MGGEGTAREGPHRVEEAWPNTVFLARRDKVCHHILATALVGRVGDRVIVACRVPERKACHVVRLQRQHLDAPSSTDQKQKTKQKKGSTIRMWVREDAGRGLERRQPSPREEGEACRRQSGRVVRRRRCVREHQFCTNRKPVGRTTSTMYFAPKDTAASTHLSVSRADGFQSRIASRVLKVKANRSGQVSARP